MISNIIFLILFMPLTNVHNILENAIITDETKIRNTTYQPVDPYLKGITMTLDGYENVIVTTKSHSHLKTDANGIFLKNETTARSQQSSYRNYLKNYFSFDNTKTTFKKDVETSVVNIIESPLNQDSTESIEFDNAEESKAIQQNANWINGYRLDLRSHMENREEDFNEKLQSESDPLDMNNALLNLLSPYDLMLAAYKLKHNREPESKNATQNVFVIGENEPLLLGIHCNSRFRYGVSQSIVLSMNKLGSITAFANLTTSTNDYLIDAFMWTSNNGSDDGSYWRYTQFLGKELKLHGIREHNLLPFQSGYYRVVTATFWDIGKRDIHLYISDIFNRQQLYGSDVRHINVVPRHRLMCYPKIKLPQCSDPENVLTVDVTKVTKFQVVLEEDCGMDSYEMLNWNLFGLSDTDFIKHIGQSKELKFRTSKYAFLQNSGYAHLVLRVDTVVRSIVAVARCYIFVPPPSLFASIMGGSKRLLNNEKINTLYGSESRDEATPDKRPSAVSMHWHCKSTDDSNNNFCNHLNKRGKTIHVPKNSLNIDHTYQFFLRVFSAMYHSIYTETSQTVTVTPETIYTPHIFCLRNCDWNEYNPKEYVYLEARCIDCSKDVKPLFEWYYNNKLYDYKKYSGNPRYFVKYLEKDTSIKLRMRVVQRSQISPRTNTTRRIGTSLKLTRAGAPRLGNCSVLPRSGMEASTIFTVQCHNYTGGMPPVWILIESNHDVRVPIARLKRTKKFFLYLPETNNIFLSACDRRSQCDEREVPVDVDPANVTSSVESFRKFFDDKIRKTNLRNVLRRDLWQRGFIIAYAVAKMVMEYETLECLHREMSFYQTEDLFQLEQYMFLTVQLVSNVRPFYHDSAALIADYLHVIGTNMDLILQEGENVYRKDFNKMTRALLYILLTFSSEREDLTVSMCQSTDIMCIVGEKLSQNYLILDPFDPQVALKVNNWLKASVHINQNFYMLTVLASFSLRPEQNPIKYTQENAFLKFTAFSTSTGQEELISQDGDTKVIISKEFKNEINEKFGLDNFVMLILTQPDDDGLYWWYPEPVPIISTIITVYAANEKSDWHSSLSSIKNPIIFDVNSTMSHNLTEDWFINGTLLTQFQMQTFSTVLMPQAVLLVSVTRNTDEIKILATQRKPPSGRDVHNKGCTVKANATEYRLRLSTYCKKRQTIYIAVTPNIVRKEERSFTQRYMVTEEQLSQPIHYSFMLQIYQCTDWVDNSHNPGWTPNACQTDVNLLQDNVRCSCYGLGPFSPRIYRAFARPFDDNSMMPIIMINWILVFFYLLLLIILLLVIFTYVGAVNANIRGSTVVCLDAKEEAKPSLHRIVVVIRTGGQANAGTTANIGIFFQSVDNKKQQIGFVINQDPEHPKLNRNAEITIRLKMEDITLPTLLRIEIDKQGRYPTWYCRRIIINNLSTYQYQTFLVRNWIHDKTSWFSSPHYGPIDNHKIPYGCRRRMKNSLEENFNNWFFLQPLTGPWRNSDFTNSMNRLERSCLWICKVAVTICIVASYFGGTTNTYDKHVSMGSVTEVKIPVLIKLSVICFIVCIAFDILFRIIIMHWILKRY